MMECTGTFFFFFLQYVRSWYLCFGLRALGLFAGLFLRNPGGEP